MRYQLKIKNRTYKAIIELIRDGNFTTGKCLNYEYFSSHYKLIAIELSKQKADLENQQINFIGKLEQDATIFFVIEEEHQTGLEFSQNPLPIV